MCDVCLRTPCNPRCPNAPEPPAVYTCKYCGEPITDGEAYFELDGDHWHDECFQDNAVGILLETCGATKGIAERSDDYE